MEDLEIVNLYFERSETAIRETEKKYGAFLHRVAENIIGNRLDTEEVVSDTYMGAWNAIPPTRPDSLKHFLSRIARNLSFDRLDYRNAKKRRFLFVELDECIPDGRNDPEILWEAKEIGAALNRFLKTLDATSCAVFLARYYYCCSVGELSRRYSLSARQVRYSLAKTRGALRDYLEREGVVL